MKKFVIGLGMVLMGTGAALAQDTKSNDHKKHSKHDHADKHEAKSPEVKADHLTKQMAKEYTLSEDQTAQVKSINLDFFQKKDHLKEEGGTNRKSVRELEDSRDLRLKSVLTRDQYNIYADKVEAKRDEEDAKHEANVKAKKEEKKAAKSQVKKSEEKSKSTETTK